MRSNELVVGHTQLPTTNHYKKRSHTPVGLIVTFSGNLALAITLTLIGTMAATEACVLATTAVVASMAMALVVASAWATTGMVASVVMAGCMSVVMTVAIVAGSTSCAVAAWLLLAGALYAYTKDGSSKSSSPMLAAADKLPKLVDSAAAVIFKAKGRHPGTCPVCGSGNRDDDVMVFCGTCDAPHHGRCFEYNRGCSIYACGGKVALLMAKPGNNSIAAVPNDDRKPDKASTT